MHELSAAVAAAGGYIQIWTFVVQTVLLQTAHSNGRTHHDDDDDSSGSN
jgi:hypothetical protein